MGYASGLFRLDALETGRLAALEEVEDRLLDRALDLRPVVGVLGKAVEDSADRESAVEPVEHPRVDVRGAADGGGVPEQPRHLLRREPLRALPGRLRLRWLLAGTGRERHRRKHGRVPGPEVLRGV